MAQETQFRALRQAAGQVNAQSLHSVDSLLSGMEQAASRMPLPEMDIKPDFKHIDAMEEPPRRRSPLCSIPIGSGSGRNGTPSPDCLPWWSPSRRRRSHPSRP